MAAMAAEAVLVPGADCLFHLPVVVVELLVQPFMEEDGRISCQFLPAPVEQQ